MSPTISSIIPKFAGPSLHPLPVSLSRFVPIFSPDVGKSRTLGEISSPDFLPGISWPRPGRFLGRSWAGRFHIGRVLHRSYTPVHYILYYTPIHGWAFSGQSLYIWHKCLAIRKNRHRTKAEKRCKI